MKSGIELTKEQRTLARYIYINLRRLRGSQIKRFGLDDTSVRLQIDYWVSVNIPPEGEHYNQYHLKIFSHWLAKGFIGDQYAKYNKATVAECDMESEDGSSTDKWDAPLNKIIERQAEERLDLFELLSSKELDNVPGSKCFKRLKIKTWREFFSYFKDTTFSAQNIYKIFGLTKWEFVNLSRDINNILGPALREKFPEYIQGEQRKANFHGGAKAIKGGEEGQLKTIINIMNDYKRRHPTCLGITRNTILNFTLGKSRNENYGHERYEAFERSIELGISTGKLKAVKTARGLDGIAVAEW